MLYILALLLGLVATIIFASGGVFAWGLIALIGGSYAGGFPMGTMLASIGSDDMTESIGGALSLAGIVAAPIMAAASLFIVTLARSASWLISWAGVLVGVIAVGMVLVIQLT